MKKLIGGIKDENGIYSPLSPKSSNLPANSQELPEPEVSLDDIAKRIVTALNRATRHLLEKVTSGDVSREVIGALKDCESMVRELKKKEDEFLDSASEDQLKEMLKK